jgi:hypothetical protein
MELLPWCTCSPWLTAGCNRPPASRAAAEPAIRYTDFPAAVGLMFRRPIQGSHKLSARLRQDDVMHRITPPATGILSDFGPPFVSRITSGWNRPPSSAAQPPIRYADDSRESIPDANACEAWPGRVGAYA